MKFRKILSLLLVFCMVLSFTACGLKASNNDKENDEETTSQSDDENGDEDSNDSEDEDTGDSSDDEDTNDSSDDEDTSSSNDEDTSSDSDEDDNPYKGMPVVDLPKDFPDDVFPIYKGGKVYSASSDKQDGITVYTAWVVFDTDIDTVSKYYKDIIKDAEDMDDQSASGFTVYTGKLKGYQFNMSLIADSTNNKYSVMTLELREIPTVANLLESLAQAELPEKYPADKFPIIDGGAISEASEAESDGVVSYDLTIYTEKTFKEIVAFYEEKLGTIEDKSKSISTDDFDFRGSANGFYFNIYGGKTTENNVELVRYYLQIDPLTD